MCLAAPGLVLDIDEQSAERMARISFSGAVREVSLALTPEAAQGDYVLVHAGVAISVVDEEEAEAILDAVSEYAGQGEES